MVDLGFSLSAANDMTGRVARDDHIGALVIFQSLSALICTVIVAGLAISAILIAILPIGRWMHIAVISIADTRWILWLLAASILIQLGDGINHAGFRAYGEYAFHSFFYYTTLLLQQLALWITALSGHGPLMAAFFMLLARILMTSLMTVWLFHRQPTLEPGFRYASRKHLHTLLKPALANTAMPLAQGLNIQGMVLVVGAILGPLAVVVFSTLRTLTRFALQMVLSISHTFEPELAAAWGTNDKQLLFKLYINNLRLGLWLALGAATSLFFLGGWIVKMWTHGKVLMDVGLFNWLLVSAVASVLWYGGLNLFKAANRHLRAAVWYVFSSLAAILLATLLLRSNGVLSGAGLALVIMDGMMTAYVFQSAAHSIGWPARAVFRSMLDLRSLAQDIYIIFLRKPMRREILEIILDLRILNINIGLCMKIVYIGPAYGTSLHRARALERLGHQVNIIDPWSWLGQSKWVSRWLYHAGGWGVGL